MLIKSRNFTANKCENTFEKDGFGWAPGQEKQFRGKRTPVAVKNFSDNYDNINWNVK